MIIPKTFEDLEAMSVIWFAQVSLVSSFILRYGWLETVESGTPQSEYEYSLGLVLFVIGRCTHFGMLNSICNLLDHVCSWIRSDWRMLLSVPVLMLR